MLPTKPVSHQQSWFSSNRQTTKKKGKGYGIRLYSPYRRCWSPFLGPSARKCNGGLGASHPVLLHTLPVYLPQISPGTHLELGRLWLSLQSHATDPRPKLKNWAHWDSNPRPLRQGIPNPAHHPLGQDGSVAVLADPDRPQRYKWRAPANWKSDRPAQGRRGDFEKFPNPVLKSLWI